MRSLPKVTIGAFATIAILLALLVITGFQQNSITDDYNRVVQENERIIFLYATIRDQATHGLLSRDPKQLLGAAREMDQLHTGYTAMLDNRFIPTQYKLSSLQEPDLGQVIVNLRNLADHSTNIEDDQLILTIINQLRLINKQFLRLDRIVVNEMRNRVMRYQKTSLVLMGFIISLSCSTMVALYLKSVKPLARLAQEAEQSLLDGKPIQQEKYQKSSHEIRVLAIAYDQLLQLNTESTSFIPREREVSPVINEVINRLNGIINYAQLLADYFTKNEIATEQKQMLDKIIDYGEKSAVILQNNQESTFLDKGTR